ncbi:MAG: MMPL family transporter, partial [Acidimicrobiales bacterium]
MNPFSSWRRRRQARRDADEREEVPKRGVWARYTRFLRGLRYLVVPGWIALAVYATLVVPPLSTTSPGSGLRGVVSKRVPAIEARISALHHFAFPLLAQTVVVQHRSQGLSARVQANTVSRAIQLDRHQLPGAGQIAGAIPVTNAEGLFPSSRQKGTTALTFLFFKPTVGTGTQARLTHAYAERYLSGPGSGLVGATGVYLAENAQGNQISGSLRAVELGTILLVVVVVGLAFRSVLAPVITLVSAGVAYFLSLRVLSLASTYLGVTVPGELDPVIVVLLLGIMTDYAVFFLSGFRDELRTGRSSRGGFVRSATRIAPIVLTAGLTVAASLSVILTARLPLFAALGPGLAITVFVGVLVAVTFVPSSLAALGRATYWPSRPRARQASGWDGRYTRAREGFRQRVERVTVRVPVAVAVVLIGVAALVAAASPLRGASVGVNAITILPSSSEPVRAAQAAATGFAPGIVAPTEVLVRGSGIARQLPRLDRLQSLIAHQPGVAGVIGPADHLNRVVHGAFLAGNGDSARYLVIFDDLPFTAPAVHDLQDLQSHMGHLLSEAGLPKATSAYAGDTALSATITTGSTSDLVRVGLFTLAVDFVILALYLRALVAPLVLVAASGLVVAAGLGLTTFVFTGPLHTVGFTFYVPFAAEVLLISFGSDYN